MSMVDWKMDWNGGMDYGMDIWEWTVKWTMEYKKALIFNSNTQLHLVAICLLTYS